MQYAKEGNHDVLYHFGLSTEHVDFKSCFGDVKFVLCGGSANRMLRIAEEVAKELNLQMPYGTQLKNLSKSDRFVLYKCGPVLCVNHGIGEGSCLIMLHEITKLLKHAHVESPLFFRIGTSGGIGTIPLKRWMSLTRSVKGIEPGTVVVSKGGVNGLLKPHFETCRLGKCVRYDATLDQQLVEDLLAICRQLKIKHTAGLTMGNNDFYEEQGRCDGALCSFTEEESKEFLRTAYEIGVRNFEMECCCFASFCKRAGIRAAVVCVTLLNRFEADQLDQPKSVYQEYEMQPSKIVITLIKQILQMS
ncbi:uridine phosphorylase [Trichuris suis]|nr:uridine phosphorylase [Trichuris suis]